MFERDATDEFTVSSLTAMDELASARLWLENSGVGDAWHLCERCSKGARMVRT